MSEKFWEDLALNLLEKNLNGDSLNSDGLKQLFGRRQDILDELNIEMDGEEVGDLDRRSTGGAHR